MTNYSIKNLPQLEDVTPLTKETETRKLDKEGFIILEYKNNYPVIYLNDCIIYGENTIGLIDGSKLRQEDWQNLRKGFYLVDGKETTFHHCVGGSDAGTVLGYNKYSNITDLYLKRIANLAKEDIPIDTQFIFEYGHTNEELCARGFAAKTGKTVVKNNMVFFNRRTSYMQANVDYFVLRPDGDLEILEIKTSNVNGKKEWDDNNVPLSYYAQAVLHYPRALEDLPIVGTNFCLMTDNILNNLETRYYPKDEEGENLVEQEEGKFVSYLMRGEMPPLSDFNPKLSIETFNRIHPEAQKATVELQEGLAENIVKYNEIQQQIALLKAQIKDLEKEQSNYKLPLIEALGDNYKGKIVIDEDSFEVSYPSTAPSFTISSNNLKILKEKESQIYNDLLEKGYIETKAPTRWRFSIKKLKK